MRSLPCKIIFKADDSVLAIATIQTKHHSVFCCEC